MTLVSLFKLGIILAFVSPFITKLWRKLRQPADELTAPQRRLRPLWQLQAAGFALAGLGVVGLYTLLVMSSALNPPFWVVYAIILLVGGGALLVAHAAALEKQSALPPIPTHPSRHVGRSAHYDMAWKVALIGGFAMFFAGLSVSSFPRYSGLEQPMLIVAYTLMGVSLVLAVLSGWTRK